VTTFYVAESVCVCVPDCECELGPVCEHNLG